MKKEEHPNFELKDPETQNDTKVDQLDETIDTTLDGDDEMTANANSDVDAAQSVGATGGAQEYTYGSGRVGSIVTDNDKDVGADERYEEMGADRADAWGWNGKRTYDLHQTLDTDTILQARKQQAKLDSLELAEREQRIRHTEAEFNQRMKMASADDVQRLRHADRMDAVSNSVIAGLLGDMAEKLGRIEDAVKK